MKLFTKRTKLIEFVKDSLHKYSFLCAVMILFTFSILYPSTITYAKPAPISIDARPMQYKAVKNFSGRFCSTILAGLTKDDALNIASREIYRIMIEPSAWTDAFLIRENSGHYLSAEELVFLSARNIIKECGRELDLSGEEGINNMKDYLEVKREEYLSPNQY